MMNNQQAKALLVGKLLQSADKLVVIGVTVRLAAHLPDFLQCVNDDKAGVGMLPHKLVKLFIQAAAKLFGISGEVELVCPLHAEHSVHSLLQPLVIVLQSKV